MDIHTLFLAQTCALAAIATMLWVARSDADEGNGLRTWMWAVGCQALAYLLLANLKWWPNSVSTLLGNAFGALSVALFFAAIRQFLGAPIPLRRLALMCALVTAAAASTTFFYAPGKPSLIPTIFNGFAYAGLELLNALAFWRKPRPELLRVQRIVALLYLAMGLLLPVRAALLLVGELNLGQFSIPAAWNAPIYLFGFIYIIATNLGFLQMCKMRAEADVRLQALTDGLTGLPNRRALDEAMAGALGAAQRQGQPFTLLMIDLDFFKAINDNFGHHRGDEVLAIFAQRLRAGLRAQDQAFRYGGEEFVALLANTQADGAKLLAERLRQQVGSGAQPSMPAISASFGLAVWQPGDSADAIFQRADRALYQAKALGRDRVAMA
ncbi:GGDEF domain-containing protein [Paucibacter sp. B2R-40]|uniref:GGDEF domain-containing protein n=1 Tax=Paucibacter sp. B2R-40 TaxID=2893554 RepID=UPI0021E44D00|nr:GGDEF domain-containing protein [Paucibacter sp. B2R-40]MCV2354609.1 GGDEF domain-containing protein [Paucibacter sp. B2R-40]